MATKQPFAVRLGPIERKALDLLAQSDERQPGDMLRFLVRVEAKRRGLWEQAEALVQAEQSGGLPARTQEPSLPPAGPEPAALDDDDLGYDESVRNSGGTLQ